MIRFALPLLLIVAGLPASDVPGRHEPGTGEIHYGNVFKAIHNTGFIGFVAMEYRPSVDPMITLAVVRKLWEDAAK
jgi:hydroxypyruvate isomerase